MPVADARALKPRVGCRVETIQSGLGKPDSVLANCEKVLFSPIEIKSVNPFGRSTSEIGRVIALKLSDPVSAARANQGCKVRYATLRVARG